MDEPGVREFDLAELGRYDGREGRPAYVAAGGIVYDVTTSLLWREGTHKSVHEAGTDLDEQLPNAPHGRELVELFPTVGVLRDE